MKNEFEEKAFWADVPIEEGPVLFLSTAIKIMESRICENCIYCEPLPKPFAMGNCEINDKNNPLDYGCIHFERKEDES